MTNKQEKESKLGLMEVLITVLLKTAQKMDLEFMFGQMVVFILVNGKLTKSKEKENMNILMEDTILDHGIILII